MWSAVLLLLLEEQVYEIERNLNATLTRNGCVCESELVALTQKSVSGGITQIAFLSTAAKKIYFCLTAICELIIQKNAVASTSHNPMGLHGLLQG
jgi:hypothetical protein